MRALVLLLLLQQQSSPRPAYPQRTAEGIYQQLGVCNADLADMRSYIQSLNQTLDARDKEIGELKAQLAKSEGNSPKSEGNSSEDPQKK